VAAVAAVAVGMNGALSGSDDAGQATLGTADEDLIDAEGAPADRTAQEDMAEASTLTGFASRTESARSNDPNLVLSQAEVIRTGSLSLETKDLGRARDAITGLLEALDGYVASENTQAGTEGAVRSATLVLKVPTGTFDTAMARLEQVGGVRSRTVSTKDVTRQVADVESRVASARAALERIRLLLGRADTLGMVIRLESVLSDRQAELESLLAQQRALAGQTQMATIDVTLTVPRPAEPKPETEQDDRGFLAGLSKGWNAFTTMALALATAAGALLPFAGLLVLLGVPAWLLVRRYRETQRREVVQTG